MTTRVKLALTKYASTHALPPIDEWPGQIRTYLPHTLHLQSHPRSELHMIFHHRCHQVRRFTKNLPVFGVVGQGKLEVLEEGGKHRLHLEGTDGLNKYQWCEV